MIPRDHASTPLLWNPWSVLSENAENSGTLGNYTEFAVLTATGAFETIKLSVNRSDELMIWAETDGGQSFIVWEFA